MAYEDISHKRSGCSARRTHRGHCGEDSEITVLDELEGR